MRACGVWLVAVAVGLVCGCGGGDGPKGVEVSGTVTLNGTDLPEGEVMFEPADGKGVPEQALVKGGKFSTTLTPGAKKVRITSWKEGTGKKDGVMGTAPREQFIPKRYNTDSTLTATVDAGKPQLPPFELKSP